MAQAQELSSLTGVPCTTSSSSIVKALRAVSAQRISVASPYEPWLNERVASYLQADGFEVLAIKGLGTQSHSTISTEAVKALAHEVMRAETEALFISCSNFRTLDIISELEADTGVPVITSNQAAMWGTLRSLLDMRVVPNAGRLFQIS